MQQYWHTPQRSVKKNPTTTNDVYVLTEVGKIKMGPNKIPIPNGYSVHLCTSVYVSSLTIAMT